MKLNLFLIALFFVKWTCRGQGAFIYDQQATAPLIEGAAALSHQPMGQSFTPSLSSVGFVDLFLFDSDALRNSGSTVMVNLRANSITGTILGSSGSIFTPDGYFGTNTFRFSVPIIVTPGVTYYFQPLIQSGDNVSSQVTAGYPGGFAFSQGVAQTTYDLWFREGIISVPEPSSVWLILLGSGVLFYVHRKRILKQSHS